MGNCQCTPMVFVWITRAVAGGMAVVDMVSPLCAAARHTKAPLPESQKSRFSRARCAVSRENSSSRRCQNRARSVRLPRGRSAGRTRSAAGASVDRRKSMGARDCTAEEEGGREGGILFARRLLSGLMQPFWSSPDRLIVLAAVANPGTGLSPGQIAAGYGVDHGEKLYDQDQEDEGIQIILLSVYLVCFALLAFLGELRYVSPAPRSQCTVHTLRMTHAWRFASSIV